MFLIKNTNLDVEKKYILANRMIDFPCYYFQPNKPQAEFIKAIGTKVPEKRIFLETSANNTGKTALGVNIVANVVFKNINVFRNIKDVQTGESISGFFDYPFFNNFPKNWPKQIWYVSNQDTLKSIWNEFKKWIPKDWMYPQKEGKQFVSKVEFIDAEWTLFFKTVDQDPKTFEGARISIMICDEPIPYNLYQASLSRLMAGGIIIILATPLFGSGWFVDEIVEKAD